jgi:hypothetical protein
VQANGWEQEISELRRGKRRLAPTIVAASLMDFCSTAYNNTPSLVLGSKANRSSMEILSSILPPVILKPLA